MEHPAALREGGGTYRWHAGAPDDESFARARDELLDQSERVPARLEPVVPLTPSARPTALEGEPRAGAGTRNTSNARVRRRGLRGGAARAGPAPSRARRARRRPRVRLSYPRLRAGAPRALPRVGIAEQDMVSAAGRDGPPRPAPRRQLFRALSRRPRERADLQPGERAHEGRLRDCTTRASFLQGRASPIRACATCRCSLRYRT